MARRRVSTLRSLRSKQELAARLFAIIGPAEELFWRGVVQHHLMDIFGKPVGAVLGTAALLTRRLTASMIAHGLLNAVALTIVFLTS